MRTNLALFAFIAFILLGCGKKEELPYIPEKAGYVGTVTVLFQGAPFDNEGIEVEFDPSEDTKTASITIHKIKFVPQMPVTIDVTIPDINISVSGRTTILAKDQVVPLAMGGEYPRYTVTSLTGKIEGEELAFSLNFGDYPTSFKGVTTR